MTEIKFFSGKPFLRNIGNGEYSVFKGQTLVIQWLKEVTSDEVLKEHWFTIDGKEVGEAQGIRTANELRSKAIRSKADNFQHEILTTGDGWKIKVDVAWLYHSYDRYTTWMECHAFVESDALAVQLKLAAPWEMGFEQDRFV
jgi:hypothetical protein